MNSFCGLVIRSVARKTNSTVQSLTTCLTFSRAYINTTHKCFRYSHLVRGKSSIAIGCSGLSNHLQTEHTQDLVQSYGGHQLYVRFKSRSHGNPHVKSAKKQKQKAEDDSESDDEDDSDEYDDGAEVWDKHFDEDDGFPERCKEIKKRVNSLRCDAIVSAGLATSRRKVEDLFLASQLYHNGQKVLKAGKKATEGDYIDVLEKADGEPKVKRVRIVQVGKVEGQDKVDVYLRCWRSYITTDQYT